MGAAASSGAASGSVYIRRAGSSDCFAKVEVSAAGDVVTDLAARSSLKLGWGVSAASVGLFLVRPGGSDEPSAAEEDGALKQPRPGVSRTLADANIVSGAWRLARLKDPPAGGGVIAAARGALLVEDRLRAHVREEVRAGRIKEELSISKAISAKMDPLLDLAGVYETVRQDVTAVPEGFPIFADAFDWSRGDGPSTADACARLTQYLVAAGVAMAPFSTPGFKLVNVHQRSLLSTQLANIKLKGGMDAIVIPSTQDESCAMQQARLLVDFKISSEIEFDKVLGQAKAKLLAASSLSHHDVMVVFTDLSMRGHALRAEGGQLLVWRDMDFRQTLFVMSNFLTSMCATVGVPGLGDDRVPGNLESKRRRKSFCDKVHGLLPSPEALMEQLAAFPGDGLEDLFARRDILMSAMGSAEPSAFTPSYFS